MLSKKEKKEQKKLPVNPNGEIDLSPQRKFVVKRTGHQIARLQNSIKRTAWVTLALVIFVILLYLLFIFFTKGDGEETGDFTVEVDPGARGLISLSETSDFDNPSVVLEGASVDDMWHCTRSWIPTDIDAFEGGSHNSTDPSYLAYTFYLKNACDKNITYKYDMTLVEKILDTDEAVRVMLIKNEEATVYAKPPREADPPLEDNTVQFISDTKYVDVTGQALAPDEIDKYTVVIWMEGEDPQCIDELLSGKLRLTMDFKVEETE